ncbi:hypothetical protein HYE68_008667 [Fusarium pseudograminearum]|nr:hypothetical protein HYE68_008667 [Fusarium pseudograminearum]
MNTHRNSSTNGDRDPTLQNKRWTIPSDDGAVSKILPKSDNTNDTDVTVSRDVAMEDPEFIQIADNDDDHFAEITTRRSIYDKLIMSGGGSGRIRDRCSGGKLLIFVGGPWPPVNVPRFHQSCRRSPPSPRTSWLAIMAMIYRMILFVVYTSSTSAERASTRHTRPTHIMNSREIRRNYRIDMSPLSTAPIFQDSAQRRAD